jgi:hypothetical protein
MLLLELERDMARCSLRLMLVMGWAYDMRCDGRTIDDMLGPLPDWRPWYEIGNASRAHLMAPGDDTPIPDPIMPPAEHDNYDYWDADAYDHDDIDVDGAGSDDA